LSSLELQGQGFDRFSWQRDLFVIGLWLLWLLVFISFELPHWLNVNAWPLLILYGSLRWKIRYAVVILLGLSVLFSSFSLIPSGLLWTAVFSGFLVSKLAQRRLELNNAFQFALGVALLSLFLDLSVFLLMNFASPTELYFSWRVSLFILSSALFHGIIGWAVFPGFRRLTRTK